MDFLILNASNIIVTIIVIMFCWFTMKELALVSSLVKSLRSIGVLAPKLDSIVYTEALSTSQVSWLNDYLVCDVSKDAVRLHREGSRFLAKYPTSQLIPECDLSRYKSIPALLTSIGITGTFLGITLGLANFNMAGDSASLLASAASLLDGMKTAFYTSLAGLSASALFMLLMKFSADKVKKEEQRLYHLLAQSVTEASSIKYLKNLAPSNQDELVKAQQKAAKSSEVIFTELKGVLSSFDQTLAGLDGSMIAEQISLAVSGSIRQEIVPVFSEIRSELASLKDIKEANQKELVGLIISEMKHELIEPVTKELANTSLAVNESNVVTKQLNETVGEVLASMAGTVQTIDKFQQDTMLKLQNFAQTLQGILVGFKEDTQGTMTQITSQVEHVLAQSILGMDKQREHFKESANKAAAAFEGINTSMNSALNERQIAEQALFDNIESRLNKLLSESSTAFDSQTLMLEKVGGSAASLMKVAKDELEQGLGDIDTKVKNMSQVVQGELDTFRVQYQENLSKYFEQQNNLLETSLGKQRNGLTEVIERFKTVFESEYQTRHNLLKELTDQYDKLQQSATTIERVAKAIGLNEAAKMAELQDASKTLAEQVGKLKREYAQAAGKFAEITEGLPKAMDEYYKQANFSTEKFFKEFDTAASAIHNRLAQAADYLIDSQIQQREFEADRVAS